MRHIVLRPATLDDAPFAVRVTDACMRLYAEQTWGTWDGRADFDPSFDRIIQLGDTDIGLIGVCRHSDYWFLDKLYLLPSYQGRGLGGSLLRRLMQEAGAAQVPLRLTVLEVNPARRFYERHGFVLTHTISPRHHLEWSGGAA